MEILSNLTSDNIIIQLADPSRCLLYTSDAADEEDSVDIGGRRINKKKNRKEEDTKKKMKDTGDNRQKKN